MGAGIHVESLYFLETVIEFYIWDTILLNCWNFFYKNKTVSRLLAVSCVLYTVHAQDPEIVQIIVALEKKKQEAIDSKYL